MTNENMKEALADAIKAAGSQGKLAKGLTGMGKRISQQAISGWMQRQGICPAEFAAAIESLTGVSRHKLRPDVFGPLEQDQQAA